MQFTIRKSLPQDIPVIFALIKEFADFQKTPGKVTITPEQMEKESDFFQCMVAVNGDNTIVGFATFFFAYYSWSGKAMYLDDLYIQPAFRGNKAGTLLLTAVKDYAKSSGCKKLRWQVSSWNDNAITFYKGIGAEIDDTEVNCDLFL